MNAEEAKRLLSGSPTHDDLCIIILHAPESYKSQAWNRLLAASPPISKLGFIMYYSPEPYKGLAQLILDSSGPLPTPAPQQPATPPLPFADLFKRKVQLE